MNIETKRSRLVSRPVILTIENYRYGEIKVTIELEIEDIKKLYNELGKYIK